MLAAASIGAIWSSTSVDFGVNVRTAVCFHSWCCGNCCLRIFEQEGWLVIVFSLSKWNFTTYICRNTSVKCWLHNEMCIGIRPQTANTLTSANKPIRTIWSVNNVSEVTLDPLFFCLWSCAAPSGRSKNYTWNQNGVFVNNWNFIDSAFSAWASIHLKCTDDFLCSSSASSILFFHEYASSVQKCFPYLLCGKGN